MAAEKTTKKATSTKKVTKKAEIISEKSFIDQLVEKQTDLLEARKSLRAGELVNPRVIASYRKDVARLKTAINADKLKESK